MNRRVNWFGLAGGVATVVLIAVSLFVPWWRLQIGNPALVEADTSPVYASFEGMGNAFTIPLLWALNIASIVSLAAGGVCMLIYSAMPVKPYSKRLLGFGYNKPLYAVAFFAISLLLLTLVIQGIFGFNVPLTGSATVLFPESITQGATISVAVSSGFLWPFWLGIATAVLCLAARLYHRQIGIKDAPVAAATKR